MFLGEFTFYYFDYKVVVVKMIFVVIILSTDSTVITW